ncbi:response regulator [Pleurocapsales cyanobacterium LEGE 10410]|nr:response regulator [Pleurocapsales cyanobacterium LEGE 10410]
MNSNNYSGKILIVDDNPDNLKVLYTYLRSAGFEVLVAEDGIAGIEAVKNSRPELILLDVMMPELDGFEVCRRLKADSTTQNIPIIFLTALSETISKLTGFQVGGVDYITQPIENEEVVARVRTHLILAKTRQKLEQQNHQLQTEITHRQQIEQELKQSRQLLQQNNDNLEQTIADRTAELATSNQELEHFAYIASHDLRQPIRKIKMCTEYLVEDYGHCFDQEAEKYIGYITKSTDRLYLLIDDLLTYSRIGRKEKNPVPVDLETVVSETIEDFSINIQEKQATIHYQDLPTVEANPREIRQLFQNLIGNSLKFSGDRPPEIAITAKQKDHDWLITLKDNGIGNRSYPPPKKPGKIRTWRSLPMSIN